MIRAWYWHKNRQVDQCDRIKDAEISPHNYNHLVFDKNAKNIHWRETFLTNGIGKTGYPDPYAKINSIQMGQRS
jgi:hypothetical protein